jgi:hypothetical protein
MEIITRLWWDGRRGIAQHGGVTVDLHEAPHIGVDRLTEIDFAPALHTAQLRVASDARREMEANECHADTAMLERISKAAHAAESESP